jgi:hypothetical protein
MTREITVILKQPEGSSKSLGQRFWNGINDFIKSPVFVFLIGSSFITLYPTIKNHFTSQSELEAQRVEAEARADAALVAPFLANLSTTDPGRFLASSAALHALEFASKPITKDKTRLIFTAVNKAIDAVAINLYPPTDKSGLTKAFIQKTDNIVKPAISVSVDLDASYSRLQNSIVYIQVEKNKPNKNLLAQTVMNTLRAKSILAPGIERLDGDKIPQKTQVRYFYDTDLANANDLAAIVKNLTTIEVFTVILNLKAKKGTLELWFGK